jgi:hypothetical protein
MFALIGDTSSPLEWAATITAVVGSISAAIVAIINSIRTKDVQKKVDTGNGKTIGEAVSETHHAIADALDPNTSSSLGNGTP